MDNENTEDINRFFDVDEDLLNSRVKLIREELENYVKETRKHIDQSVQNEEELWEDENFIKWNIANLILLKSDEDPDNTSFNRLIYFLYEETGNIESFVKLYKLEPKYNEGKVVGYGLLILEPK